MSVLIKSMEMPETCDMCPLLEYVPKAEDHEAFCFCRLDHWKEPVTPNPIQVHYARRFRQVSCPLLENR